MRLLINLILINEPDNSNTVLFGTTVDLNVISMVDGSVKMKNEEKQNPKVNKCHFVVIPRKYLRDDHFKIGNKTNGWWGSVYSFKV